MQSLQSQTTAAELAVAASASEAGVLRNQLAAMEGGLVAARAAAATQQVRVALGGVVGVLAEAAPVGSSST